MSAFLTNTLKVTNMMTLSFAILSTCYAYAQSGGNIAGTVSDSQGFALPGATVTATNVANRVARTATTDDNGFYSFTSLPPAQYMVKFEASNFRTTICQNVNLYEGQTVNVSKALEPGLIGSTVSITEDHSPIDQTSTEDRATVTAKEITELPLVGRTFADLALLTPGVLPKEQDPTARSGLSVAGGRPTSLNVLVDGADSNDTGEANLLSVRMPFDAIREFSVTSNSQAEFGRSAGGLIQVVTQSGTTELKISAFYNQRNSALGSRDFFENRKSHSLAHQFGFTAGGPIKLAEIFLFGAFDGTRDIEARPRLVSVPSPRRLTMARSVLAASGLIENPLSTEILRLFPSPEIPRDFYNRSVNSPAVNNTNSFLLRLDRYFRKGELNARYNVGSSNRLIPSSPSFFNGFRANYSNRAQFFTASYSVLLPRLVYVIRFTHNRNREKVVPEDADSDPSSIGLNTSVTDGREFGLPLIKITGFDALGSSVSLPQRRSGKTWQLTDTVTLVHGKHEVKGGLDYHCSSLRFRNDTGIRGRISFDGSFLGDSLADFLAGLPSGNTGIVRGDTDRRFTNHSIDWFVQDSLRLVPNLTLNFGIRYEFTSVLREKKNLLSNFIPEMGGLVEVGEPQLPALYKNDLNNFAPRVGVNWLPLKSQRLNIRTSWGVFFDNPTLDLFARLGPFTNSLSSGVTINSLGTIRAVALAPPPPIPFGLGIPIFGSSSSPPPPFDLFAVDRNLRTPFYQRVFLGVQYEFLQQVLLQVDYSGSVGKRLYRTVDVNQPFPGDPLTRDTRRPFSSELPLFRAINTLIATGTSRYNSLRFALERRFHHGWFVHANWTLSKNIDDASSASELPQDGRNLQGERGPSSFDQHHKFMFSGMYEFRSERKLLNGWEVSGVYTVGSGNPITPTISFDNSGTGMFSDRPDAVNTPRTPVDADQIFEAKSFQIPPRGSFGNVGRNSVIGPGINNLDFSIHKKFYSVSERRWIDFRLEIFNILNHPNFQPPNRILDDPAFGRVNATDPQTGRRRVQIGIRLNY
jgi:hypothetical protein